LSTPANHTCSCGESFRTLRELIDHARSSNDEGPHKIVGLRNTYAVPRKRPSFSPQAKRTVTIELTEQQLTDIRVSVLTRLDRLTPTKDDTLEAHDRYRRIRALMDTGGPLFKAMVEIKAKADITS